MLGGEEGVGIWDREGRREGDGRRRSEKKKSRSIREFKASRETKRAVYEPALAAAKILSFRALLGVPCQATTEGKGVEGG